MRRTPAKRRVLTPGQASRDTHLREFTMEQYTEGTARVAVQALTDGDLDAIAGGLSQDVYDAAIASRSKLHFIPDPGRGARNPNGDHPHF
jgi:hypothetical protein